MPVFKKGECVPGLIVKRKPLNERGPFIWAVSFTTTEREYPLAYDWTKKDPNTETHVALLCDQLITLDVHHYRTKLVEHTEVPAIFGTYK